MQADFNQQLLQSQLEMQEQTFNIISTEIHDNVGQILSLAKVQLNIIDQGEMLDRSLLADAKESVSKAMIDLRDIAKSLNSERIKLPGAVNFQTSAGAPSPGRMVWQPRPHSGDCYRKARGH